MSKPKIQKVPSVEDRRLPVFAEIDRLLGRVREQAYTLFEERGFAHGFELEDWLKAERDVCGPAAELIEGKRIFTLKVELPGFDSEDITVTANPREIIIKAARRVEREGPEETRKEKVRWSEIRSDDLYRRIELPADVEIDQVIAKFENGLLTVKAPKAITKKELPRRVTISKVEVA